MPVDSVTYPSGNSYNRRNFDPATNPRGLANGGTDTLWLDMCQDQIDVAAAAVEAATTATGAAAVAQAFAVTSTTSASVLTIGTGPKTAVMADPLPLIPGTWVTLSSSSAPVNFMIGLISSRDGLTLNITVPAGLASAIGGAGTYGDWRIQSCGAPGATGSIGPTGPALRADPAGQALLANLSRIQAYLP